MACTLALLVALLSLTTAASSETPPGPTAAAQATLFAPAHTDNRLVQSASIQRFPHSMRAALACCKVCTVGKACGNTCVSRNKTCHVGQGCACDG
jgi:hypothetical protein